METFMHYSPFLAFIPGGSDKKQQILSGQDLL